MRNQETPKRLIVKLPLKGKTLGSTYSKISLEMQLLKNSKMMSGVGLDLPQILLDLVKV